MSMTAVPAGGLTPAAVKQTLASNYIDFANAGAGSANWAQQYLPDLMEKEAEVFGNRTISGFLAQVGAEEAMSSDQVIWSEQGRLHLTYTDVAAAANSTAARGAVLTMTGCKDVDGNTIGNDHGIRPGDMLLVADANTAIHYFVQAVAADGTTVDVEAYHGEDGRGTGTNETSTTGLTVMVYGSEYVKGSVGRVGANAPSFKSRTNKPIILKDKYEVSGSDASAIGWVEVSGEEGQNGYMWYLKASGDTKARFSDYCEMALLESRKGHTSGTAAGEMDPSTVTGATGAIGGTEGLWAALESRGNIATAMTTLADYDDLIAELDKNGAIEENMMFLNRAVMLQLDDILGAIGGGYASTGPGVGASFGVFNNDSDMALNLGFSGFRRGSYDFYKSDFKYLNDFGTRGAINASVGVNNAIEGVLIPAGVSSVYDQSLGKNLKRPFLHVRYRASNLESRKMKTWTTGSVGATTSDLDAMEMHFLSERCLVTQGANNFVLFKS